MMQYCFLTLTFVSNKELVCIVHQLCGSSVRLSYKLPVAVWRSGSPLVLINELNLCRARLVLGWMTGSAGETISVCNQHPGQLSLLPSVGP